MTQRTDDTTVAARRIINSLPCGAAASAALLRIALGLVYLRAFVEQDSA